jgi:hypothetical protein
MTSAAIRLREAVIERLSLASVFEPFGKIRRTIMPQAQPDDMPLLSVFIMGERSIRDGEGYPQFETTITIACSVVRGFDDPAVLDGIIDEDVNLIENTLLTDPSFIIKGPDAYFESIESMTRRRLYPQGGETYFSELRLEMEFLTRVDFRPVVPDDYRKTVVTTRPIGEDTNTPGITVVFDEADT